MQLRFMLQGLLPLGLLAFAAVSVKYVNFIFRPDVRWLILALIISTIALRLRFLSGLKTTSPLVFIFLLYACFSTAWSSVPLLSATMSFLQLVVTLSYISLAVHWTRSVKQKQLLNFLWPLVGLAIFASVAGTAIDGSILQMNEFVSLYRGLSYNPNYLGLLALLGLPLPLFLCSRSDISKGQWWVAIGILVVLIIVLFQTVSRASILAAGTILLFFFIGRGLNRLAVAFAFVLLAASLATIITPQIWDSFFLQWIQKGETGQSIFYSREQVFGKSIEAAKAGGVFGLGHGVSHGLLDYNFGQGTAIYGREKGNATLATLEELGLVGLFLFLGVFISVVISLVSAIRIATSWEDRTLLFLVLGTIIALWVHAQFEAWLLSPGAAAMPVFWAFIGIAGELSRRIQRQAYVRRMQTRPLSCSNCHSGQQLMPGS